MIKLTALNYKVKIESLERYHNINEHNEKRMHNWKLTMESADATGQGYTPKPFAEPFEFKDSDYDIVGVPFRVNPTNITIMKQNIDGNTDILVDGEVYVIKEKIEVIKIKVISI